VSEAVWQRHQKVSLRGDCTKLLDRLSSSLDPNNGSLSLSPKNWPRVLLHSNNTAQIISQNKATIILHTQWQGNGQPQYISKAPCHHPQYSESQPAHHAMPALWNSQTPYTFNARVIFPFSNEMIGNTVLWVPSLSSSLVEVTTGCLWLPLVLPLTAHLGVPWLPMQNSRVGHQGVKTPRPLRDSG